MFYLNETPRALYDFLTFVVVWDEKFGPPTPMQIDQAREITDPAWKGRDEKNRATSKDKKALIWRAEQRHKQAITNPKVIRLEAPKPQPSNPEYGERIRRQDIENEEKYQKDKEAARLEIEKEIKRRKEDARD